MNDTLDESLIANLLLREFSHKHRKVIISTSDAEFNHDLEVLRQKLETFAPMSEKDSNEFKSLYLTLVNQKEESTASSYLNIVVNKPLSVLANGALLASLIIGISQYFKISFLLYFGCLLLLAYVFIVAAVPKYLLVINRTIKLHRMLSELPSKL